MDTFSPPCPQCGTPAAHPTSPGSFYCAPCGSDFGWEEAKDAQRQRELRCWCGGEDGEHNDDAHAAEGEW